MVHICMLSSEKYDKSSNYLAHLSLSLDNSSLSSLTEIRVEPLIKGGPSNSLISLDNLKNMELFHSSSNVAFSISDFRISTLPFQPTWICLILGKVDKDCVFLDSSVRDWTLRENVDTWLRDKFSSCCKSNSKRYLKDLIRVPILCTIFIILNASAIKYEWDLIPSTTNDLIPGNNQVTLSNFQD